jgi:hypothetical protein
LVMVLPLGFAWRVMELQALGKLSRSH